MGVLKRVVKLSRADFKTLTDKGTVTVDGQTIEYSNDDIYVVPNIEIDHSQYIDISSNQVIKGVKTFEGSAGTVRLGLNGCVEAVDANYYSTLICGAFIQNIGDSGYMDISYNTGIRVYDMLNGTNSIVKLPMGKMGTLATTDDCKSRYEHTITVETANGLRLTFKITNSRPTMYTSIDDLKSYITLPNIVKGVACVLYDINHSPSFNAGVIMSAIDGGSGIVAIQVISTYSESGTSLTGYNTFVSDTVIEL
jgi:hypothetical protein